VAKRNRYRELESLMTKVIIGDAFIFILYLIFAANDLGTLKVISSIITIAASLLSLGWLYLTGEFKRRRSLWMVTGFIGIALCVVVSLLLGFPGPSIV
jgi:hypothetical protein